MSDSGQGLKRYLTLFPATNIVVANMIGAGIFTTSGLLLAELHDPVLMISLWVVGGILALAGAMCYGALGSAMPEAGGEYHYLSRLYHPILGFLSGWISFFVGFSAPLAASALGFAEYTGRAFPDLIALGNPVLMTRLIAAAAILILTSIHLRGLELGARIQNILTVGKVVLILAFVGIGFLIGNGSFEHFAQPTPTDSQANWRTAGLALMWIMFGYSGWNAAGYIGSEIHNPKRNLPLSLLLGTGLVTLLYLAVNVLYVYAVPPGELEGVLAVGGLAASRLFGITADRLFSSLIAFALLSSISALILLGPRIYYAMAKDGVFFKSVKQVSRRFGVPSFSIGIQSLLAIVMVATGSFDQILTYMGFCLGIFPLLAVLGVFHPALTKARASGNWWLPIAAIVYAVAGLSILALSFLSRPLESSIALATVATGIPFYFWFRRSEWNEPFPESTDNDELICDISKT